MSIVAVSGLGRMGGSVATRLRDAGHDLRLYDASPVVRERFTAEGYHVSGTLLAAASGADVAFLCLPDGRAVEESVRELIEARPRLVIDLTSSEPAVSRRVARSLAGAGIHMVDSPVSGGVAGALAGRLTAIVGGEEELVNLAREWLAPFASTVLWAGPIGSGDAAKAINNSLSAASLALTAEMYVATCRAGYGPGDVVEHINSGGARSQNSEVKFPHQVLTGRYGAGFTAGLMLKDIGIALDTAKETGSAVPFGELLREGWAALVGSRGEAADFTRIVELAEASAGDGRRESTPWTLDAMSRGLEMALAVATWELLSAGERAGLDRQRMLTIVNASSGRNEWTRGVYPGPAGTLLHDACAAMSVAVEAGRRQAVPVPLTAAAAAIGALALRTLGNDADLGDLSCAYALWSRTDGEQPS